jgi:hypothetical protein
VQYKADARRKNGGAEGGGGRGGGGGGGGAGGGAGGGDSTSVEYLFLIPPLPREVAEALRHVVGGYRRASPVQGLTQWICQLNVEPYVRANIW